jgi:hypothetical protein
MLKSSSVSERRMMTKNSRRIRKKEEEIIDLLDYGNHNTMPVIRELEQDPVTGLVTMRSVTDSAHGKDSAFNDSPVHFVAEEDRGQGYKKEPDPIPDPDGNYEEQLENEGAFIINSTTYYPASGTTVTKKSQTPAEIAEERGYHDFYEPH